MANKGQIDVGLKLLHQAFGLEMLHFGLFEDGVPHTLDGIREAQAEYTRVLIGMIPEGVKTVLDVGCGLGGTVKALAEAGFAAEGLSPDPYQEEEFHRTCGDDTPFHLSRFEDFGPVPTRTFDCLIFSESPMYIDKDRFFPKCVELTGPGPPPAEGSHVLVADFFGIAADPPYKDSFRESDFLARAERAGFRVTAHRDITREVLPNLDVSRKVLEQGRKLYEFVRDSTRRNRPALAKIVRLFFRSKLKKLDHTLYESLPAQIDDDRFLKTMHYAMYLLSR